MIIPLGFGYFYGAYKKYDIFGKRSFDKEREETVFKGSVTIPGSVDARPHYKLAEHKGALELLLPRVNQVNEGPEGAIGSFTSKWIDDSPFNRYFLTNLKEDDLFETYLFLKKPQASVLEQGRQGSDLKYMIYFKANGNLRCCVAKVEKGLQEDRGPFLTQANKFIQTLYNCRERLREAY